MEIITEERWVEKVDVEELLVKELEKSYPGYQVCVEPSIGYEREGGGYCVTLSRAETKTERKERIEDERRNKRDQRERKEKEEKRLLIRLQKKYVAADSAAS
jgi:hypothetical protein